MRDVLSRLLPRRAREEWFEPSCCDAQIANRRWLATRTFLIFLQCWGLELRERALNLLPSQQSFVKPTESPKERIPMFWHDLRHAFRLLLREPGFTLAAVLTLALGVGGNVAVFAVVEAVLLRPLPYVDADSLVILRHRDRSTAVTKEFIAIGDYVDLAKRQAAFESIAAYGSPQVTIYGMDEPFRVRALSATADLLDLLRVRPQLGRLLTREDTRPGAAPVVVLSDQLWKSRFAGDPKVVGRGVKIGARDVQVIGVVPPGFHFPPTMQTDVIIPQAMPLEAPAGRKNGWTYSVARLKPGVGLKEGVANLAAISKRLEEEFPRSNQSTEYYALPLRDALVGDTKAALVLILGAVGVVLLIACANVANLLLARSLGRHREMAVRVALGAGQKRLVAQLLAESLALALCAGTAGVLIAIWGTRALVTLVPKSVDVPGLAEVHVNAWVLGFALLVTLATALVFGMLSALAVRKQDGSGVLVAAGRSSAGGGARRAASALVVGEVALAIVLLIGAGLILRSFSRLLAVDPGFTTDRVLTMEVAVPFERYRAPEAAKVFWQRAFEAVRAIPDVQEIGAAVVVPLTGNHWTASIDRPENPTPAGERPPEVGWQMSTGGFFKVLQIPLLSGRYFDDRDRPGSKTVVIVSEGLQKRYFDGQSAVGREILIGQTRAEIVGVVGNIRRADLSEAPRADLYFPFEINPSPQIRLFLRTAGDPAKVAPAVQSAIRGVEPSALFPETITMAEVARASLQIQNLALWLLGLFAATALALAAVGIYGVMSYTVRQRTREIGTRIALGATDRDIVWMVLGQGARLAVVGAVIGLTTGLLAARALGSLLFGVKPSDPLTLASATVVLIATIMIACYLPARRAARIDPARTLAEQ
ncbi:MAG TPA: ABC transporter permease [Bryobacteraceae bacterium]|jgi:predicted permease|nr:ABC transporter permease [Bryobacteraceae bacterium]